MILIKKHNDDNELVELYSVRDGKFIVWASCHVDMLSEFGLQDFCADDLDNMSASINVMLLPS